MIHKETIMQTNNHKIVDYDPVLDEKFGKEGTIERAQEEDAAHTFYSGQNNVINKRDLTVELRGALTEAKESIEGKRKLNTLDNLINELRNSND